MNNVCPKYWHNYFTFNNEIHSKNLRSAEKFKLYIPNPKLGWYLELFTPWCNTYMHHLLKHLNPDI